MHAAGDANDVLASIYDAAFAQGGWRDALGSVAGSIGGASSFFFSAHSQTDRDAVAHVYNHAPTLVAGFFSHWHTEDAWEHAARRKGLQPGQVVIGTDLLPRKELLATAYYQDFLRPHEIESMVGAVLFTGAEGDRMPFTHLCWYRPPGRANFAESDRRHLQRLVPHFQRSLRLQRRISWVQGNPHNGVPDALYVAAIELNRRGAILRHNDAARALLDQLAPSSVRFGVLRSVGERCTPPLPIALATCTPANPVRMTAYLRGPSPLVVSATLVQIGTEALVHASDRYLLLAELPRRGGRKVAESVSPLFALTPAETRVLGELLEGRAPAAIAVACGTSLKTVRTQISSILAKTSTRGQAELLLLLRSLRF